MSTLEQAAPDTATDPVARLEYVLIEYMQGNLSRDDVDAARAAVYAALDATKAAEPVAHPRRTVEEMRELSALEDLAGGVCAAGALYTAPPAQPAAIPEGWRLVPVEPTPGMLKALNPSARSPWDHQRTTYAAMLSAAPPASARAPLSEEQVEAAMNPCDDSEMGRHLRREFIASFIRVYNRLHGIGADGGDG